MYSLVPTTSKNLSDFESRDSLNATAITSFVQTATSDANTLLKSALYSVGKGDCKEASQELEKLRRINRSHEKKMTFLIDDFTKKLNVEEEYRRNLIKENRVLKETNKTLLEKVAKFETDMEDLLKCEVSMSAESDFDFEDAKGSSANEDSSADRNEEVKNK